MNISATAKVTGVSAKMIRHYEQIGLIAKAPRSVGGYRTYSDQDVCTLRFIRQARNLGFSLQQISELLSLWHDRNRHDCKAKALAMSHIATLDERIRELNAMKYALAELVSHCHGDEQANCSILEGIAGHAGSLR